MAFAEDALVHEKVKPPALTSPVEEHLTDFGNARRFVALHGEKVRYAGGSFYCWTGDRWRRDETGEVYRRGRDVPASLYREASEAPEHDRREKLAKFAVACEAGGKLTAMLELVQSEPEIATTPDAFDSNPMLLNVGNGVVDLRTGALLEHEPRFLMTKLAAARYMPGSRPELLLAVLARIFDGDDSLVGFIQRALGYSLTGSTVEQVFFMLYGLGANGKSTLLETVRSMLGDYAIATGFETFLTKRNDEGPRNDIAALRGSRMVTASEAPPGKRLSETVIKQLSGGDVVRARHLYQEAFEFRPVCKIWLSANHKPTITDTSHAMWRRVRLIPFTVTIPPEERRRDLLERLREEADAILTWMVEGCLEWQRHGLGEPDSVAEATAAYREDEDALGAFVRACCELGPKLEEDSGGLYRAYKAWTEKNEESTITQTAFGRALGELGLQKKKRKKGNSWLGISLQQSAAVEG